MDTSGLHVLGLPTQFGGQRSRKVCIVLPAALIVLTVHQLGLPHRLHTMCICTRQVVNVLLHVTVLSASLLGSKNAVCMDRAA